MGQLVPGIPSRSPDPGSQPSFGGMPSDRLLPISLIGERDPRMVVVGSATPQAFKRLSCYYCGAVLDGHQTSCPSCAGKRFV